MKEFMQRAWSDIQSRKNLELYLTLAATITIFVGDVFGIESSEIMFNVILGVLSILIFNLIEDRHFNETQGKKLDDLRVSATGPSFFKEWNSAEFDTNLKKSESLCGVYTANYEFFRRNFDTLKELVRKGGTVRLLYVNPESQAINTVLEWPDRLQEDKRSIVSRLNLTYQLLQNLSKFSIKEEQIQVKLLDRMAPLIFTILDAKRLQGTIYVTINGFQVSHGSRPSFILSHENDKKWFDFFTETFDNLWLSEGAININVNKLPE